MGRFMSPDWPQKLNQFLTRNSKIRKASISIAMSGIIRSAIPTPMGMRAYLMSIRIADSAQGPIRMRLSITNYMARPGSLLLLPLQLWSWRM